MRIQVPTYRFEYFHLNEMQSERDKERIPWFYRVGSDHTRCAVCIFIDVPALERIVAVLPWRDVQASKTLVGYLEDLLNNPYVWAFWELFLQLPVVESRLGIDSPIDFYFDETDSLNKWLCLDAWDTLKRHGPPAHVALMGESPAFRNDKIVLPLQAADLWAGTTRQWAEKLLGSQDLHSRMLALEANGNPPDFPWQIEKERPTLCVFLREKELREKVPVFFEAYRQHLAALEKT